MIPYGGFEITEVYAVNEDGVKTGPIRVGTRVSVTLVETEVMKRTAKDPSLWYVAGEYTLENAIGTVTGMYQHVDDSSPTLYIKLDKSLPFVLAESCRDFKDGEFVTSVGNDEVTSTIALEYSEALKLIGKEE